MRIILVKLLTISVAIVLFSGCYGYNGCHEDSQPDCINSGLLDTTMLNKENFLTIYHQFLEQVDTAARPKEKIKEVISQYVTYDMLNAAVIKDTEDISFHFRINPEGKCGIYEYSRKGILDTVILKKIRNKIATTIPLFPEAPKLYIERKITLKDGKMIIDTATNYCSGESVRSKESIMNVVMKYLGNLRIAYNRRLVNKNVIGKITVMFAVDHYGAVIFAKVINSTANDLLLEKAVIQQIRHWKFEPIPKPDDVTEIVYPFVFSR